MTLLLSLLLSLTPSASAEELCPLYRCIAKPKVITRRIHLRPGFGYGDTVQNAGDDAIADCQMRNAPGRARYCQVKSCTKNTGPVFPVFSSCKSAWE